MAQDKKTMSMSAITRKQSGNFKHGGMVKTNAKPKMSIKKMGKRQMDNTYLFLRAQVKAFHPQWSDEQVDAECKKILAGDSEDADDGCLYCGS